MDEYVAAVKEGDAEKKESTNKAMWEHADKNMFAVYDKLTDAEKPVYDKRVKDESARMAAALAEAPNNKTKDEE
jgi:hypothetical protein